MAFDGVLAFQGRDHITASQLGRIVEGVAGRGRYILPTLHGLKATMQTANKVRVDTGDLVIDGRVVTNEEAVDLTVESGTSGYKRNDLVVCHYRKDVSTGVERFDAKVLKGTPTTGTPADPTYDAGDISAGGSEAIMPLWRIPIDGITPGTPVQVADTAQSLKSLGDSVSRHQFKPQKTATFTAPCSGLLLIRGFLSDAWGYGGCSVGLTNETPSGLTEIWRRNSYIRSGDTIGRLLSCSGLYSGVIEGNDYTVKLSTDGAIGHGVFSIEVEFMPM